MAQSGHDTWRIARCFKRIGGGLSSYAMTPVLSIVTDTIQFVKYANDSVSVVVKSGFTAPDVVMMEVDYFTKGELTR